MTLFPDYFEGFLSDGVVARAIERGKINVNVINLRDFALDRHRITDERPFGGGPGMVMKAEPIYLALKERLPERFKRVVSSKKTPARASRRSAPVAHAMSGRSRVILLSPQGQRFDHACARRLASYEKIFLICGRYEGVDERIMDFVDEEISMGDFVMTGGEIPAMAVADAVSRLSGGVVKESASVENDSFYSGLLDCPHYTRPRVWRGRKVPVAILSGDHGKIKEWRREKAFEATHKKRPDLLKEPKKEK